MSWQLSWQPLFYTLKFIAKGPTKNNPAVVQIMAGRQPGDKPLSQPMMAYFTDAYVLTQWGRVTHICFINKAIIGSDNGLSPNWRQAII